MADDVSALGIKALKELIASAGLTADGCIDKDDLRTRAREAQAKLAAAPPAPPPPAAPSASTSTFQEIAGYQCIITGPPDLVCGGADAPADLIIIGLHGLGAEAAQLAELTPVLSSYAPALNGQRILGVYPQAPQTPLGAAWWTFNAIGYMTAVQTRDQELMAKLIREKPEGLDACRASMGQLVEEARKMGGGGSPAPSKKLLLAGFSLGAITSLDTALQRPEGEAPGGVLFLNGAPICVDEWAERLKLHKGLRVHMSGGMADMTLPHQTGGWVHQLLETNGADVKYKLHPGGHDLGGPEAMTAAAAFVAQTAAAAKQA